MNYVMFENSSQRNIQKSLNRFPCKSIDWFLQDVTHIKKKRRHILTQAIKKKIFRYKFFQLGNAVKRYSHSQILL